VGNDFVHIEQAVAVGAAHLLAVTAEMEGTAAVGTLIFQNLVFLIHVHPPFTAEYKFK
jgi:hypothetical protein